MQLLEKMNTSLFSETARQLVFGALGAAILMLILHLVDPIQKPRIATLNLTGIVNQFVKTQTNEKVPAKELQAHAKVFGKELETAVDSLAQKRQLVLLPKEAVIAGAYDLTPVVEKHLLQLQSQQK